MNNASYGPYLGVNADLVISNNMLTNSNQISPGGQFQLPTSVTFTGSQNNQFQATEVEIYKVRQD